jgi:hypothetical protein
MSKPCRFLVVTADILVGGVRGPPARIADRRPDDAVDLAECGLDAPEATGGERRPLKALGRTRPHFLWLFGHDTRRCSPSLSAEHAGFLLGGLH